MFPQISPLLQETTQSTKTSSGKSFLFDFSSGDFVLKDGKLQSIDSVEALKVWIIKILKTEKFKFKIYEKTSGADEYGVTLIDLINSNHPQIFIQAEMQREITEALKKNIEILNVRNFNFVRTKRNLEVSFTVDSIYGSLSQEVVF